MRVREKGVREGGVGERGSRRWEIVSKGERGRGRVSGERGEIDIYIN